MLNDCNTMATLVDTNKLPTKQKLVSALDTITKLTKQLASHKKTTCTGVTKRIHYCWTYGDKCDHDSRFCCTPAEGHKIDATATSKHSRNEHNFRAQA